MKKLLVLAAFAVFGLTSVNAQEDTTVDKVKNEASKLYDEAKTGGFKVGANIGLPLSTTSDFASFNVGADVAYLFEVIPNLEVGLLVGFTQFFADGEYVFVPGDLGNDIIRKYEDATFIPIAATARYYFGERKFFGGLDLGYAISVAGDADGGFYARPKFGFDLGVITLIASYQSISGGVDYYDGFNNFAVTSGFNSFNVGAEFSF